MREFITPPPPTWVQGAGCRVHCRTGAAGQTYSGHYFWTQVPWTPGFLILPTLIGQCFQSIFTFLGETFLTRLMRFSPFNNCSSFNSWLILSVIVFTPPSGATLGRGRRKRFEQQAKSAHKPNNAGWTKTQKPEKPLKITSED